MGEETIEVLLGKNGEKKVFDSLKVIDSWVKEEQTFWNWLQNPPWTNAKQNISPQYQQFFNNVSQFVQQAIALQGSGHIPDMKNRLASIKGFFEQFYKGQWSIYSGSPLAAYIEQVREREGDVIACTTMCPHILSTNREMIGAPVLQTPLVVYSSI